jgi:molecular chaperone GrpE
MKKEMVMPSNGEEMHDEQKLEEVVAKPDPQAEQNQPEAVETVIDLEDQLAAETRKAEEYLNLLRRTQADFVNYRRRALQEQAEGRIAAQGALLSHLLPMLDDFDRALTAVPDDLANHPWVGGILLISKRLMTELEQLGVRQIGAPGQHFDPRWHEAIMTQERSDIADGSILTVARPGYVLGDRVIRPAQVIVAVAPSANVDTDE